jgi:glutamate synthase (NADPH/NADH) small chain
MDQKELRVLEKRCIQEEVPVCIARCPIHVDVRTFLKRMAEGVCEEAFQTLAAVMPFPGILGRICDHPCEAVCRRIERGGAIAIGDLERAVVKQVKGQKRYTFLPPKGYHVAVVGGGLGSLTTALDLLLKGYQITLFEPGCYLGATLQAAFSDELQKDVIDNELKIFEESGTQIHLLESRPMKGWLETILAKFDAICIDTDCSVGSDMTEFLSGFSIDPLTLATSRTDLFIAGRKPDGGTPSPIGAVADGRKAAVSIDRYLQKVSLTAGRDLEGPYETRLYTNMEDISSCSVVPMEDRTGYSDTEAQQEARRCIQCECMECVKVCSYLEHFKSYPKRYVRQIYNNETILIGSHGLTNKLINSCSLCGLCGVTCPNDLNMAQICMEGRVNLVARNKMPPSAHAFALEDMRASNSEKAILTVHEPGKDHSNYVFFPGCQLAAIYPEHVLSAYTFLRNNLQDVGLMLRCCGVPARWAAREDLFEESLRNMEEALESLGNPTIIVACPTCYQTLKERLPQIRITTLWQILADTPGPIDAKVITGKLAIHDPCSARYETDIQNSVRKIVTGLGCDGEELVLSREKTECCGFGGLMSTANPPLARDVAKTRGLRSETDYVTYCAMCRNALAASGKRVLHVLDLIFPADTDPCLRKASGYSDRNENRYRLKETALKTIWGDKGRAMEAYETIELHIADDTFAHMEERRILRSDVQKVIDHAEKTGKKLFNPATGRSCASFRPGHVTYWVEYSPEGNGFTVHSAYCHRMEIVEERGQ